MAILDDLLNRWKEKTPEEKIDLTQPAPPVVSPVSKIINSNWQNTASGGKRTDGTPLVDGKNLQQSWENTVAANRFNKPSFEEYYKTVPPEKSDTTNYNLRRAYELAPYEDMVRFALYPNAHLNSVYMNPNSVIYEFVKSKNHPTLNKELEWYYSDSPDAIKFRNEYRLDTNGDYYRYVPIDSTKPIHNRPRTTVPYIDTTTGYGVSADGTSEKPVFHVTPEQAAQMREAAEAGESFVSIYNRILKRPEEIDPRIVENRRKLAVLGDVGATLAEIIGVAAGGNAAARKPSTAVNNAFLQNLLDRRDQMQMLYDQGLLKAAFQDKVGRDAAQAAEAQREYEGALAEWERANELNDLLMKFGFEAGESEKERSNKKSINDANNATKIQIAADNNKTKYGIASMKNKDSDLYKKGSDIPLSGGKRIKISESELPFSAGSLFQAARQAVIDAGLGDEKMKNEYGKNTTVSEQLI